MRSATLGGAPRLHYLEWNPGGRDTLILVHGNSANAWWWRWVAEGLAPAGLRIIALDLRGHGDSEWVRPPEYSPRAYAQDIARVIDALKLDGPIVAGHSMGGLATLALACAQPELVQAIIAIDIPVTSSTRRNRYLRHLKALPTIAYPDLATAQAKFRLMPNEGAIAPEIIAEVAEHSLMRTANGRYTMKFDRESFFGSDGLDVASAIRELTVPMLLIRAGESRILTADAAIAATQSNSLVTLTTIADTHHHLILEQPIALAAVIKKSVEESGLFFP